MSLQVVHYLAHTFFHVTVAVAMDAAAVALSGAGFWTASHKHVAMKKHPRIRFRIAERERLAPSIGRQGKTLQGNASSEEDARGGFPTVTGRDSNPEFPPDRSACLASAPPVL